VTINQGKGNRPVVTIENMHVSTEADVWEERRGDLKVRVDLTALGGSNENSSTFPEEIVSTGEREKNR